MGPHPHVLVKMIIRHGPRVATLVKHVVIRKQKNAGKGTFFTHRQGPCGRRLG